MGVWVAFVTVDGSNETPFVGVCVAIVAVKGLHYFLAVFLVVISQLFVQDHLEVLLCLKTNSNQSYHYSYGTVLPFGHFHK